MKKEITKAMLFGTHRQTEYIPLIKKPRQRRKRHKNIPNSKYPNRKIHNHRPKFQHKYRFGRHRYNAQQNGNNCQPIQMSQ